MERSVKTIIFRVVDKLRKDGFADISYKINERSTNHSYTPSIMAQKGRETFLFDVKTGIDKANIYLHNKWRYLASIARLNDIRLVIVTTKVDQAKAKFILNKIGVEAELMVF